MSIIRYIRYYINLTSRYYIPEIVKTMGKVIIETFKCIPEGVLDIGEYGGVSYCHINPFGAILFIILAIPFLLIVGLQIFCIIVLAIKFVKHCIRVGRKAINFGKKVIEKIKDSKGGFYGLFKGKSHNQDAGTVQEDISSKR